MSTTPSLAEKRNHWSRQAEGPVATTVLLYYIYTEMTSLQEICREQLSWSEELGLMGRVRVSSEGMNGTLDGTSEAVEAYTSRMDLTFGVGRIDWKLATYPADCSRRFKGISVKETKEVISTDIDEASRQQLLLAGAGKHLSPVEWHAMLCRGDEDDSLVLVDTRNFYETRIGRFERPTGGVPIDPMTRSFSDFFSFVDDPQVLEKLQGKRVMMYCTGGVRCERASAYLKSRLATLSAESEGATTEVYQLSGGIHRYMEQFPDPEKSLFKGKNFVYDPRITVGHAELDATATGTKGDTVVVVGKCIGCGCNYDDYSFQVRCLLCRVLVLACPSCCLLREQFECELCVKRGSGRLGLPSGGGGGGGGGDRH